MAERWSRHVQAFGPEHQAIHAGMGLRISDIGFGAGHRLLQRHVAGGSRRLHGGVELAEADRGELADKAGEIAEMMGRGAVRYAAWRATARSVSPASPSRSNTYSAACSKATRNAP
jgi:hypothetical protein